MNLIILSRNSHIYSTSRLVKTAVARGHKVRVVDHGKCTVMMEKGSPMVYYFGDPLDAAQAVIPRIGASVTFFGTAVVRQFEAMHVYVANSSISIVRSRDKLRSMQILSQKGIAIPRTAFAKFPKDKDVERLIRQVGGAPLIIKLLEGTQGLGVVLAETNKAAKSVVEAFSGLRANILIQEYIRESAGADVRAFVVGDQVVGAQKRTGKEGDFRSNLHRGGTAKVIELSEEEKSISVRAAKTLGLNIAGVDLLQSSSGPLVLEVNSSPGLEGIEAATGVDIAAKIIEFVEHQAALQVKE